MKKFMQEDDDQMDE
jgi:hypothetical protein